MLGSKNFLRPLRIKAMASMRLRGFNLYLKNNHALSSLYKGRWVLNLNKNMFLQRSNSLKSNLFKTLHRSCSTTNLKEAHDTYGLFRKGQNIGYTSTLMQDPKDAQVVTEKDYHELHHYFDIPELAENITSNLVKVRISKRTNVPYNSPTGSWMQVIYPFAENKELAGKYKKFAEKDIIVGKMLEEIDALWAETAYRYIRGKDNNLEGVSTVTAAVDHLEFDTVLSIEENLKINTYVIYTGSSTIYVKSDMYSKTPDAIDWTYKGHTIFIMAARQGPKSFQVPPMEFEGEDDQELCKMRHMLGKELKEYIITLNNNLYKQAPNKKESKLIHDLFKKIKFEKTDNMVTVSDTVLKHNTLMHKQEKNSYGKVFGGFLMNRATEAAFLNVRRFSEELNPKINHIDTIKFIKPVEVGHIMQFRSRVTYATGNMVRVAVAALDISENNEEGDLTNEFHFVFKLDNPAKEVVPETYFDALLYLEGKRRTEHLLLF